MLSPGWFFLLIFSVVAYSQDHSTSAENVCMSSFSATYNDAEALETYHNWESYVRSARTARKLDAQQQREQAILHIEMRKEYEILAFQDDRITEDILASIQAYENKELRFTDVFNESITKPEESKLILKVFKLHKKTLLYVHDKVLSQQVQLSSQESPQRKLEAVKLSIASLRLKRAQLLNELRLRTASVDQIIHRRSELILASKKVKASDKSWLNQLLLLKEKLDHSGLILRQANRLWIIDLVNQEKKRNRAKFQETKRYDLAMQGELAILYAITKYDPKRAAFNTYITPWIKFYIQEEINGSEGEAKAQINNRRKLGAQSAKLIQETGQQINETDLSQEMQMSEEQLTDFQRRNLKMIYSSEVLSFLKGKSQRSMIEEELALSQNIDILAHALEELPPRYRVILEMHYGLAPYFEPLTLVEIGKAIKVSSERARQLEAKAFRMLRQMPIPEPL